MHANNLATTAVSKRRKPKPVQKALSSINTFKNCLKREYRGKVNFQSP